MALVARGSMRCQGVSILPRSLVDVLLTEVYLRLLPPFPQALSLHWFLPPLVLIQYLPHRPSVQHHIITSQSVWFRITQCHTPSLKFLNLF